MRSGALYRIAAVAGVACAVILVFNSFRRGGAIPENGLTHTVAPFGALAGVFALSGLYLYQRVGTGTLGTVAYALNATGLIGAFAIEYIRHFVFPNLDRSTVDTLVAGGSTRAAFLATAFTLIVGALLFGVASWRAGTYPRAAVLLYALGLVPGSLAGAVPEIVYLGGLCVAAVGVAWMSLSLYRAPVPA
jgi:hypothetical protein